MTHPFDFDQRTAGAFGADQPARSIQSWKTQGKARSAHQIEKNFEAVLKEASQPPRVNSFVDTNDKEAFVPQKQTVQRYEETRTAMPKHKPIATANSFKFGDVIDIINPLQHLPIIGSLYRGLTGDEIKPMAQIIGGGIYGGPVGAVSGTANAVAQVKTGKDITGNLLSLSSFTELPLEAQMNPPADITDNPEKRLDFIASKFPENKPNTELPGTALAFANLSEVGRGYTETSLADGRTAGSHIVKKQNISFGVNALNSDWGKVDMAPLDLDTDVPRLEAITQLSLSAMPPRQLDN